MTEMNFARSDNFLIQLIYGILYNRVLMSALVAWVIAAIAKAFVTLIAYRRIRLEDFLGTGGMPSTHTSPVACAALMLGFMEGFTSTEFGIGVILLIIVMWDASGIRRAAGRHARAINMIFRSLVELEQISKAQLIMLRELLGHEPIEVAGGALIGLLTAFYIWAGGWFQYSS